MPGPRIEPEPFGWEAEALPLSYTPLYNQRWDWKISKIQEKIMGFWGIFADPSREGSGVKPLMGVTVPPEAEFFFRFQV